MFAKTLPLGCLEEEPMSNQIVWCDIPVFELDRAVRFYSAVLGTEVKSRISRE